MATYTPEQIKRSQDLIAQSKDLIARAQASQAPVTRYSETVTPSTSTPPGMQTPSSSPPISRYSDQYASLFKEGGAYGNMRGLTAEDENRIRDTERVRVQSQIDAINEAAEQELAAARVRGQERSGRGRAIRSATGTEGSPMGDARANEISAFNDKEQNAIRMEKQAKIDAIMNNVAYRGDEMIQKYKTEARGNADKFIAYLADVANQSRSDMQALATAGAELAPDQRSRLIEQTGYDEQTFDTLYKSMKISNSEEYINKNDPEIMGNKAIFFKQTKDPLTGKISLTKEEVELPETQKAIKQIVPRDDGMYVFYEDGTWNKVGAGKGPSAAETKAAAAATASAASAVSRANDVKTLISEIKSAGNVNQITGAWEWRGGLTGANQDLIAKVNRLKSLLTIDSIKNFKGLGAMSDREFSTAAAAATAIALNEKGTQVKLSQSGFGSELDRIDKAMQTLLDNQGQLVATGGGTDISGGASGGSVQDRAANAGYDYGAMIESGYTDAEIDAALQAAGQ